MTACNARQPVMRLQRQRRTPLPFPRRSCNSRTHAPSRVPRTARAAPARRGRRRCCGASAPSSTRRCRSASASRRQDFHQTSTHRSPARSGFSYSAPSAASARASNSSSGVRGVCVIGGKHHDLVLCPKWRGRICLHTCFYAATSGASTRRRPPPSSSDAEVPAVGGPSRSWIRCIEFLWCRAPSLRAQPAHSKPR